MTEETKENKIADKTAKKVSGKPFQRGKDSRRNLTGRPKGVLNFKTIFEQAVKKVAKTEDIKECDVEVGLIIKAISKARGGSYHYYKDIFDRIYGQPKASLQLGIDDDISGIKIEIIKPKEDEGKPARNSSI